MDRIEILREKALNLWLDDEFYYLFFTKYETLDDLPFTERYTQSFEYMFSNLRPIIFPGELIVGSRCEPMPKEKLDEWEEKYRAQALAMARMSPGQDSHMTVDYDTLLSLGINGIISKIDSYMANCDEEKLTFYDSCKRCLKAIIKHSENYSERALQLSRETNDEQRKAELIKIAEICKKVPAEPAETFHEAIQSVHFVTHCLTLHPARLNCQQFQLGRPDRYLLPYYEKDIANGTLTDEYAQLLLDCLGIQINMRVHRGLSSGYMVGGRDKNGNIVANPLTKMCMQVIEDIRLVYPSVGLCYTEGMPHEYLEKACSILAKGHSHPAIFNDDIITKGLKHYGIPEQECHDYIHSTCVEITPISTSNVWVASPYTNTPLILLDIMDKEYNTFDDLLAAYFARLDESIKVRFEAERNARYARAENTINPLLSCFVNDCLEKGLDIERGGARYNWIMPSFVGVANLVDSLYAIKTLVFDKKELTISEYKAILDQNFEGNEALRLRIINKIPKYGNDIDEIDQYFGIISDHIANECTKYFGPYTNGNLIPSVFCWVMHEQFGRHTIATPDGRPAHFPLGDGSGACQGREMNGPTASILSATKWDHSKFIGGVAVNLKFSKASLGMDSTRTMRDIISTYLKLGGFEVQINVLDNETLRKAQATPEQYRDLVVRIGGYSDYFTALSPQMQEEVIARTSHVI